MLVKSPVSRFGGKSYLVNWLREFVPENTCYVEPFAGGAKLLFSKEPSRIEVLNDADDDLVNLYRCIQNSEKRSRLIALLNETPYARSVFQSLKYGENTTLDDIEKAGRYYFLCKASFAGDVERGGFAVPSKGTGRNPTITFRTSIGGLESVADRLKHVVIENLDFADCIQRYDSPDTLFYCDPPYLDAEHYYGAGNFALEDHYRLSELLHVAKGKVMVSHYSNELYDSLYKGWQRYGYAGFKGSHKADVGQEKPKTIECLFMNFNPAGQTRSLFQGVNL